MGGKPQSSGQSGLLRWGSWLYLGLAIAAILWLGLRDGAISLSLFLKPESWLQDLGLGLGTAALMLGTWQLGVKLLPAARRLEELVGETLGSPGAGDIVVLALLSGFAEELFFRGAVQSQWGPVPATVLFGLLHMGPGREFRLWTLFALVAGALFAGLTLWRGTLLAPVVAHVVVNLVGLSRMRRSVQGSIREGA